MYLLSHIGANMADGATIPGITGKPGGGISLVALVVALTIGHGMASMALLVLPAVAPAVARDYGVDASLIGYQISLVSVGMLFSLVMFGNLSRKLGGCRTNQLGHCMVVCGMLLMLLPSMGFIILASLAIGLGFGLLAPSTFYLLTRFAPVERRNLVFSLQQTSVPFGGILAASVSPIVAVTVGWRWSLALSACLLLAVIAMLQRGRARWDDDRDPATPAIARDPLAGFRNNWRDSRLRLLSITGGTFCWAQFCVLSYTVVACVEALGMSLIVAGTVLMAVQLCNAAGRVIAGWLADWLESATRVLEWMAWMMLATCVALIWLSPTWPAPLVYVMFALLGITSGAWAGILLAELGHRAPKGHVSTTLSGALVYVNIGKFLGPSVFALTYAFTKSYGVAFAIVGIPAIVALCCLNALKHKKAA